MIKKDKFLSKIVFLTALFGLILFMIFYPKASYDAAQKAISSWWTIVLPSLLPFFIASELFLRLGGAHLLGYFLDPIMRPVFNLPGSAAVALVLGYTAGFPTGAAITAGLYQEQLCTKEEGERLLAFTNNASPLFIIITVCATILNRPQLGLFLAAVHYSLNLLLGVLLGLYSRRKYNRSPQHAERKPKESFFSLLPQAQPPLGVVWKEAISKALYNLAIIGGFMVCFSVLINVLHITKLEQILYTAFLPLFKLLGLDTQLLPGMVHGFWEITLGIQTTASLQGPPADTVGLIACILAWSGVSIQMQIAAITAPAGLHLKTYFFSRILQSILSAAVVLICFPALPTAAVSVPSGTAPFTSVEIILLYWSLLVLGFLLLAVMTAAGAIIRLLQKHFY